MRASGNIRQGGVFRRCRRTGGRLIVVRRARPGGGIPHRGRRRVLATANLREVAPPSPSRFLLGTMEAVSPALPRYYARVDREVGAWREPFTVTVGGGAGINADFYAALMDRWGLPRALVSRAI